MISEAFNKVGKEGVITVEEAKGMETYVDVVEGMQFDRGYISPYFVTDTEKMEVSEYPWKGVELPLACLCHGSSLPAALMSFTSNLAINFTVIGMNVFDDFSHFSFELEYEFVEVAECEENRVVQGESGSLSLPMKPPSGPCRGHPWLIKPKKDRFLMVSVPGRVIQGGLQLSDHSNTMFSKVNYPLPSCSGPPPSASQTSGHATVQARTDRCRLPAFP